MDNNPLKLKFAITEFSEIHDAIFKEMSGEYEIGRVITNDGSQKLNFINKTSRDEFEIEFLSLGNGTRSYPLIIRCGTEVELNVAKKILKGLITLGIGYFQLAMRNELYGFWFYNIKHNKIEKIENHEGLIENFPEFTKINEFKNKSKEKINFNFSSQSLPKYTIKFDDVEMDLVGFGTESEPFSFIRGDRSFKINNYNKLEDFIKLYADFLGQPLYVIRPDPNSDNDEIVEIKPQSNIVDNDLESQDKLDFLEYTNPENFEKFKQIFYKLASQSGLDSIFGKIIATDRLYEFYDNSNPPQNLFTIDTFYSGTKGNPLQVRYVRPLEDSVYLFLEKFITNFDISCVVFKGLSEKKVIIRNGYSYDTLDDGDLNKYFPIGDQLIEAALKLRSEGLRISIIPDEPYFIVIVDGISSNLGGEGSIGEPFFVSKFSEIHEKLLTKVAEIKKQSVFVFDNTEKQSYEIIPNGGIIKTKLNNIYERKHNLQQQLNKSANEIQENNKQEIISKTLAKLESTYTKENFEIEFESRRQDYLISFKVKSKLYQSNFRINVKLENDLKISGIKAFVAKSSETYRLDHELARNFLQAYDREFFEIYINHQDGTTLMDIRLKKNPIDLLKMYAERSEMYNQGQFEYRIDSDNRFIIQTNSSPDLLEIEIIDNPISIIIPDNGNLAKFFDVPFSNDIKTNIFRFFNPFGLILRKDLKIIIDNEEHTLRCEDNLILHNQIKNIGIPDKPQDERFEKGTFKGIYKNFNNISPEFQSKFVEILRKINDKGDSIRTAEKVEEFLSYLSYDYLDLKNLDLINLTPIDLHYYTSEKERDSLRILCKNISDYLIKLENDFIQNLQYYYLDNLPKLLSDLNSSRILQYVFYVASEDNHIRIIAEGKFIFQEYFKWKTKDPIINPAGSITHSNLSYYELSNLDFKDLMISDLNFCLFLKLNITEAIKLYGEDQLINKNNELIDEYIFTYHYPKNRIDTIEEYISNANSGKYKNSANIWDFYKASIDQKLLSKLIPNFKDFMKEHPEFFTFFIPLLMQKKEDVTTQDLIDILKLIPETYDDIAESLACYIGSLLQMQSQQLAYKDHVPVTINIETEKFIIMTPQLSDESNLESIILNLNLLNQFLIKFPHINLDNVFILTYSWPNVLKMIELCYENEILLDQNSALIDKLKFRFLQTLYKIKQTGGHLGNPHKPDYFGTTPEEFSKTEISDLLSLAKEQILQQDGYRDNLNFMVLYDDSFWGKKHYIEKPDNTQRNIELIRPQEINLDIELPKFSEDLFLNLDRNIRLFNGLIKEMKIDIPSLVQELTKAGVYSVDIDDEYSILQRKRISSDILTTMNRNKILLKTYVHNLSETDSYIEQVYQWKIETDLDNKKEKIIEQLKKVFYWFEKHENILGQIPGKLKLKSIFENENRSYTINDLKTLEQDFGWLLGFISNSFHKEIDNSSQKSPGAIVMLLKKMILHMNKSFNGKVESISAANWISQLTIMDMNNDKVHSILKELFATLQIDYSNYENEQDNELNKIVEAVYSAKNSSEVYDEKYLSKRRKILERFFTTEILVGEHKYKIPTEIENDKDAIAKYLIDNYKIDPGILSKFPGRNKGLDSLLPENLKEYLETHKGERFERGKIEISNPRANMFRKIMSLRNSSDRYEEQLVKLPEDSIYPWNYRVEENRRFWQQKKLNTYTQTITELISPSNSDFEIIGICLENPDKNKQIFVDISSNIGYLLFPKELIGQKVRIIERLKEPDRRPGNLMTGKSYIIDKSKGLDLQINGVNKLLDIEKIGSQELTTLYYLLAKELYLAKESTAESIQNLIIFCVYQLQELVSKIPYSLDFKEWSGLSRTASNEEIFYAALQGKKGHHCLVNRKITEAFFGSLGIEYEIVTSEDWSIENSSKLITNYSQRHTYMIIGKNLVIDLSSNIIDNKTSSLFRVPGVSSGSFNYDDAESISEVIRNLRISSTEEVKDLIINIRKFDIGHVLNSAVDAVGGIISKKRLIKTSVINVTQMKNSEKKNLSNQAENIEPVIQVFKEKLEEIPVKKHDHLEEILSNARESLSKITDKQILTSITQTFQFLLSFDEIKDEELGRFMDYLSYINIDEENKLDSSQALEYLKRKLEIVSAFPHDPDSHKKSLIHALREAIMSTHIENFLELLADMIYYSSEIKKQQRDSLIDSLKIKLRFNRILNESKGDILKTFAENPGLNLLQVAMIL